MNPISKSDVRNVLAQYFVSLATSPSYWFTLNSSSDDEYHLFHRLGLTNYDDYKNLLVAAGLARFTGGQFCIQRYQWENFRGHEYFITDTNTDEVLECTRKSKRNFFFFFKCGGGSLVLTPALTKPHIVHVDWCANDTPEKIGA